MDGIGGRDVGSVVSSGPGAARRGNPKISRATTVPDKVNKMMANGSSERVFIADAIDGAVLLSDQIGKRYGREAEGCEGGVCEYHVQAVRLLYTSRVVYYTFAHALLLLLWVI